jgi:hypothetical protein
MEVVIDYESLKWNRDETVVKELSLAADSVIQTWHFKSPYVMRPHGSMENGLNWEDAVIPYDKLFTILSEAVSGYAHLYSRGTDKCEFLRKVLGRPILDLDDFNCPQPHDLKPRYNCTMSCHKFPSVRCATRQARSLYEWLTYHFNTKSYVKCPADMTHHTAQFVSAV